DFDRAHSLTKRKTAMRTRADLLALLTLATLAAAGPAAHAFQAGPAFAGVSSEGITLEVNESTGRAVRISGTGLQGYHGVSAMTFNPAGALFGADGDAAEFMTIDLVRRAGTPVGGIGFAGVSGPA